MLTDTGQALLANQHMSDLYIGRAAIRRRRCAGLGGDSAAVLHRLQGVPSCSSDTTASPARVARRSAPSATAALTALQGLAALEQGTLTCEAWARACLDRIQERNDGVRAWVRVDADNALARAREWDRHGRRRLLDGVPLGIKDTIDTADMPTELGDPEIFPGRQPAADAPSWRRRMNWASMCWARTRCRAMPSCCRGRRAIRTT